VPDALPPAVKHLHDTLGIERAVLVQPSGYGTDNSRQLSAQSEIGSRMARAVVAVSLNIADENLRKLHAAGARGARFSLGHAGGPEPAAISAFAQRLVPLGWHIDLHVQRGDDFLMLTHAGNAFRNLKVPLVIAHFASIQAAHGMDQPDFRLLLEWLQEGFCWVKLSAPNRISRAPRWADVTPLAQALVRARPDRLLWGSDWPHVNAKTAMPNSTDLLDCLSDWVPDEATRTQILVRNPEALYGFPAVD
jgi:predicted TIM-barrel fold metal-dependent hydrolase